MPLMVYDTRTRGKREFAPRTPSGVLMYVCGPTVYAPAHLGHARSYVAFDVVRRYLDFLGHRVRLVQNFTDIEDSIIRTAGQHGIKPSELAEMNIRAFLDDMDRLNVRRAEVYPRVTEHIPEIVATVKGLIDKGYAYAADGSVFFRVDKAKSLGTLSHRDIRTMMVDAAQTTGGRENPLDFALWRKSDEGQPSWDSPWGKGRPGWHVECFAMSNRYLGPAIDVHCGGTDLVFPHHESELMISEAFVENWCDFWLHNAFITIEQEKMSKSLGNFVILRDLLSNYNPEAIRLCLLKEHYRKNVEYDRDCFKRTEEELAHVHEAIEKAKRAEGTPSGGKADAVVRSTKARFFKAMDDDFDTADAVHVMLQFVEAVHEMDSLSKEEGAQIAAVFDDIGKVLGLFGAK
jgi:cysteinyl-tRNA synthetase